MMLDRLRNKTVLQCGLVLFLFLLLSACGQKGPLYFPEDEQASAPDSGGAA